MGTSIKARPRPSDAREGGGLARMRHMPPHSELMSRCPWHTTPCAPGSAWYGGRLMEHYTLDGLSLPESSAQALTKAGITTPTPIQAAAVGPLLAGEPTSLTAGTGSGKTLAYLLPLLQRLRDQPRARMLVLAPTPELAVQILEVARQHVLPTQLTASLVGGANPDRQRDKLKKCPAVLVGTPGRVLDFVAQKKIKPASLTFVVLDEVEALFNGGHHDALCQFLSDPALVAQRVLVSATMGPEYPEMREFVLGDAFSEVKVDNQPLPTTLRHWRQGYDATRKEVALIRVIEAQNIKQALVFVNKRHDVPHLFRFLNDRGIATAGLSNERDKHSRQQALTAMRRGEVRLLIATDALAHGLDIEGLPWVIQYEPAMRPELYAHRAGRTGRAGRAGDVVTLVAPHEAGLIRRYEKNLKIEINQVP